MEKITNLITYYVSTLICVYLQEKKKNIKRYRKEKRKRN